MNILNLISALITSSEIFFKLEILRNIGKTSIITLIILNVILGRIKYEVS
jgi:hypothetical protein